MIVGGVKGMIWTRITISLAALLLLGNHAAVGYSTCFQKKENGTCTRSNLLSNTQNQQTPPEECCKTRGNFYVNKTLNNAEWFHLFLHGTADCISCETFFPTPGVISETCKGRQCPKGKHCIIQNGKAVCVCFRDCKNAPGGKVCATNGKTYHNECLLRKKTCIARKEKFLKVSYNGKCRPNCQNVTCRDPGKTCITDQDNNSHCISCDILCSNTKNESVCGADGVTYKNGCDIRIKACKLGKTIAIAYYHPCKRNASCSTINCQTGMSCVTDNNSKPRCIDCHCSLQKFDIPLDKAICGMDNVTYGNHCHLRAASCKQGRYIEVRHFGTCGGNSVHPVRQLPSDQPNPGLKPNPRTISVLQLLEILKKLGIQQISAPLVVLRKQVDVNVLVQEMIKYESSG